MIKTTEDSPPPTNLGFDEALKILYTTERKLRTEVEMDIVDLRKAMTAAKIDRVTCKAHRLHTLRALLNNCRVLCRQEESVMTDFEKVKGKSFAVFLRHWIEQMELKFITQYVLFDMIMLCL